MFRPVLTRRNDGGCYCEQSRIPIGASGAAVEEKGYRVNAIAAYSLANVQAPANEEATTRLAATSAGAKR